MRKPKANAQSEAQEYADNMRERANQMMYVAQQLLRAAELLDGGKHVQVSAEFQAVKRRDRDGDAVIHP